MYNHNILWIDNGLGLPGYDGDPSVVNWRTKTVSSDVEIFKIISDGRLYKARTYHEQVPPEERPNPDADPGSRDAMEGSFTLHIDEWERLEGVDGPVQFYAEDGERMYVFEAYFEDGRLAEIQPVDDSEFELEGDAQ